MYYNQVLIASIEMENGLWALDGKMPEIEGKMVEALKEQIQNTDKIIAEPFQTHIEDPERRLEHMLKAILVNQKVIMKYLVERAI